MKKKLLLSLGFSYDGMTAMSLKLNYDDRLYYWSNNKWCIAGWGIHKDDLTILDVIKYLEMYNKTFLANELIFNLHLFA